MALITRDSNLFKPVLVAAIKAKFATKSALLGTGVMSLNDDLPTTNNGRKWGLGSTIEFPYFNSIGELEDVTEGQALTPRAMTTSVESATVIRSGVAGEVTDWASMASQVGDPYEQLAGQFVEGAMRRLDLGGITAAIASPLTYLGSGTGLVPIVPDDLIYASEKWGDQLDDGDGVRLLVVHSRVRRTLRLYKTQDGIPLYKDATFGPNNGRITVASFAGIPVVTSDRAPFNPSANVFKSVILKRGALAAWYNSDPSPETDRDILAATNITALNMYHAEHLYRKTSYLTDGILPGAVVITTTEPAA